MLVVTVKAHHPSCQLWSPSWKVKCRSRFLSECLGYMQALSATTGLFPYTPTTWTFRRFAPPECDMSRSCKLKFWRSTDTKVWFLKTDIVHFISPARCLPAVMCWDCCLEPISDWYDRCSVEGPGNGGWNALWQQNGLQRLCGIETSSRSDS